MRFEWFPDKYYKGWTKLYILQYNMYFETSLLSRMYQTDIVRLYCNKKKH